jgi:PD-(D/E)XK nuclease superfamily protein
MSANLYTASRLRVWRECARKHFFRFMLRAQTPSTPAMAFGTHTHKALEHWYRAWQLGKPGLRFVDASEYIDSIADIDEVDRIRLRVLIAAYDARWGAEDWDVLAVEQEFEYWLGDVHIGGKIDAIVRERATGKVFIVEHKTSTADTSPGAPYWQKLTVDTQVSVYLDGAGALDYEIAGCIYDVLKRPQHEPKLATPQESRKFTAGKGCKLCGGKLSGVQGSGKSSATQSGDCAACKGSGWRLDENGQPEAPRLYANQRDTDETLDEFEERLTSEIAGRIDEFLSRGIVVRLDSELPRMRQELLDTIAAMEAMAEKNLAPPNHDACAKGRDMCGFFLACSGQASIHDEHIFPRGTAHPELSNAA